LIWGPGKRASHGRNAISLNKKKTRGSSQSLGGEEGDKKGCGVNSLRLHETAKGRYIREKEGIEENQVFPGEERKKRWWMFGWTFGAILPKTKQKDQERKWDGKENGKGVDYLSDETE